MTDRFLIQFNIWRENDDAPYTKHIALQSVSDADLNEKITGVIEYALDTFGEEWEVTEKTKIESVDDIFKNRSLSFFHRLEHTMNNSAGYKT